MTEVGDEEWIERQRRIIIARDRQLNSALESTAPADLESVGPDEPLPPPDDVLQRVHEVARRMPEAETGDPAEFEKALATVYQFGGTGLANLAGGARVDVDQSFALEAIIRLDGSRPSFLLEDGLAPNRHPFLTGWEAQVVGARIPLQTVAKAVGRVQPRGGSAARFIGSATLVSIDPLLALTNYHVLDDAKVKFGIPVSIEGQRATVGEGLEVDFIAEAASFDSSRFKVVAADLPAGFGRGFGHVDAAMLHLEPVDGAVPPAPFTAIPAASHYATGGVTSLCTIGFPGPPDIYSGTDVDWNWVIRTLFNNLFGYKRLAPGQFLDSLNSVAGDTLGIVFSHDATTFGGASGSLVYSWMDDPIAGFGLHFGGRTQSANYMISTGKAAAQLRAIGVPIA